MKHKKTKTKNALLLLTVLVVLAFPLLSLAMQYAPMEQIPGSTSTGTTGWCTYLSYIYRFGLWAVGIAALLMISIGGFMYISSAGNNASMEKAKGVISETGKYRDEIITTVNEKLKSLATVELNKYLQGLSKEELKALDEFEPDLLRILKQCSERNSLIKESRLCLLKRGTIRRVAVSICCASWSRKSRSLAINANPCSSVDGDDRQFLGHIHKIHGLRQPEEQTPIEIEESSGVNPLHRQINVRRACFVFQRRAEKPHGAHPIFAGATSNQV
jgi:hypothetical protein